MIDPRSLPRPAIGAALLGAAAGFLLLPVAVAVTTDPRTAPPGAGVGILASLAMGTAALIGASRELQ